MSLEWLAILLVFALLLLWFLGPRIIIDETVRSVQLPKDLNHYLNQSESRFSNIREGLNKEILWASVEETQTEYSIVYLHGFSASRQEISPVMEKVADALGANLFFTRLSGHGQTTEALSESTPKEWFQDATEALEIGKRLGEKVILVGTSTGATPGTLARFETPKQEYSCTSIVIPEPWNTGSPRCSCFGPLGIHPGYPGSRKNGRVQNLKRETPTCLDQPLFIQSINSYAEHGAPYLQLRFRTNQSSCFFHLLPL